jgi:hypothetical protein
LKQRRCRRQPRDEQTVNKGIANKSVHTISERPRTAFQKRVTHHSKERIGSAMGPYEYKTAYVSIGLFGSPRNGAEKIQRAIDEHVQDGWELFEYHPVQTAFVWNWNIVIFRRAR